MSSRLAGPDAGDISRLGRDLGLTDRARTAVFDDDPYQPPGISDGLRDDAASVGGAFGPVRLQGNGDGALAFGFATSLRDILRYADDEDAREAAANGLGLSASKVSRSNAFDVWIEGKYASFSNSDSGADLDGHFGLLTIGADYVVSPKLLLGALVQFDSMSEHSDSLATDVSGNGWMAGPYATLRLSDHLFLQARAAWGQSSNEVSPFLTYTDNFDSTRWLVSSALTGYWTSGPWSFKPLLSATYMEDTADSYVDTFGAVIPEVTSRLGQAKAGAEVGYRHTLGNGLVLEPHAGLQVIWNFADDTDAAGFGPIDPDNAGPAGVRGRAELGLRATTESGISLDVSGSYDGIGADGDDTYGARVTLRIPLN
jgi:outer membrane autotransporter protein